MWQRGISCGEERQCDRWPETRHFHRCGPVMPSCRHRSGSTSVPSTRATVAKQWGHFLGTRLSFFVGIWISLQHFLWAKFWEKISLFAGDIIDCRFQTVVAMALLVSALVHIYLLAESPVLCQCDGRVFIRAATCGIPLLAARISRDNYPLGPPPPSKLFPPLSFTRHC